MKLSRLMAALLALALFAAACSSSDESGDGDSDVDAVADEAEAEQAEEVEAGQSAGEDIRENEDEVGEPVHGGTLIYAIEADVANPWAPYGLTCSISCAMPLGAVSDPLFDFDGVHLSTPGYILWAHLLSAELSTLLAKDSD